MKFAALALAAVTMGPTGAPQYRAAQVSYRFDRGAESQVVFAPSSPPLGGLRGEPGPGTWDLGLRTPPRAIGTILARGGTQDGLASKYPGDAGIERDPDVLLSESFETDSWKKTWQEIAYPEYKETDPGLALAGGRSLRLNFTPEARDTGAGWMHYWWEGSDEVYLRYYFRLSKGGDWRNNKLLQLHAHPRGERYGPGAGKKPTGFDTACSGTGVGGDPGPPWTRVMLYTYWPGQKGPWGDNVMPNQGIAASINEEEWTCYEVMVKLNDVGIANGAQRLWINGRLVIEQTGMEWRKTDKLVLNNIMISTNTSEPPKAGARRSVWVDGIVLAKRYVGPMRAKDGK